MNRGMITSIDNVTQVSIKIQKKKKGKKKMHMSVEHSTKHTYEYGMCMIMEEERNAYKC